MRQRCRKSFSWLMTASSSCVLPVCRRFLSWWPSRTGCPSSCARWRTQRRRFSELPLNQPKHRADREADWPLLALLHFVDLLQRDGSQRLPLLRRRRRGSTYQKQTETRDLVTMGRVIFSVCVWFHLNFVRKKPLFKSLLWSVEWTKRQSSHSDWKRDSKSDV